MVRIDQTDLGFGLALGYCYTDLIVHLRDGDMLELVTPTIRQGGVNTVFVMVCIHLILSVLKKKRNKHDRNLDSPISSHQ